MSNTSISSNSTPVASPITFTEQAALKTWELIKEDASFAKLKLLLFILGGGLNQPLFLDCCKVFLAETALKLRVFITGGGCHGFRYDFDFVTDIEPGDTVISKEIPTSFEDTSRRVTVELLVDKISKLYLQGVTIDYKQDINGERFIISGLKAKTTCGCGSSFAV